MKEMKDRLTEMRKQAKLSQQDLADKLFVSRSTVSRWENGELTPSIANLKEMAKLYGVSLDYLCGSDEQRGRKRRGSPQSKWSNPVMPTARDIKGGGISKRLSLQ